MSPLPQPIRLPAKPGRLVPLRFLETTDSLIIVAGAARRPALFPQLFPIPDPGRHLGRQRESELMREHTHLPAMVGFVRKHVAQHFQANRPRPSPAVSAKLLDAAPTTAERSASISAQRAALSANPARACCGVQCARLSCGGTFRCGAVSLTHLERTLCMCVKIAAIVRDLFLPGGLAVGGSGTPGGRVKMFDKNLVDAIVGEKDPGGKGLDCGSAELSANLVLLRGQGCLLLVL